MKPTVSGTDDPGQRRIRQTATSSEAKLVTTPNRNIIYTTAQLHETNNNQLITYYQLVRYLLRILQYPVNNTYNKSKTSLKDWGQSYKTFNTLGQIYKGTLKHVNNATRQNFVRHNVRDTTP